MSVGLEGELMITPDALCAALTEFVRSRVAPEFRDRVEIMRIVSLSEVSSSYEHVLYDSLQVNQPSPRLRVSVVDASACALRAMGRVSAP